MKVLAQRIAVDEVSLAFKGSDMHVVGDECVIFLSLRDFQESFGDLPDHLMTKEEAEAMALAFLPNVEEEEND